MGALGAVQGIRAVPLTDSESQATGRRSLTLIYFAGMGRMAGLSAGKSSGWGAGIVTLPVAAHSVPRSRVTWKPSPDMESVPWPRVVWKTRPLPKSVTSSIGSCSPVPPVFLSEYAVARTVRCSAGPRNLS